MSDLPLYDSMDDVPEPLPRDQMRFESVTVRPYADGRRLRLQFKFPLFQERPSVDAWVTNRDGLTVASMSLIEAMEQDFDFTLHLRGPEPVGAHTLHIQLFYLEDDERPDSRRLIHEQQVGFDIQAPY